MHLFFIFLHGLIKPQGFGLGVFLFYFIVVICSPLHLASINTALRGSNSQHATGFEIWHSEDLVTE